MLTAGIETAVLLPLVVVLALEWDATGAAFALLAAAAVYAIVWAVLYARISREPRTSP